MLKYNALTIEELGYCIIRHPLIVSSQTTVRDAINLISSLRSFCQTNHDENYSKNVLEIEARSSCVIVVEEEKVIGILTERDIVRLSVDYPSLNALIVGDVMKSPVITLREKQFDNLFSVINLLHQYHIRHLPILDQDDHLVGLVTHESLRQLSRPIDLLKLRQVREIMITEVICTPPQSSLLEVARIMMINKISCVVITENIQSKAIKDTDEDRQQENYPSQKPLGIITERDLVQFQALNLNLQDYQVHTLMSTLVFNVNLNDSLLTVQQLMEEHLIRRLLVTGSQGEILGIVTQTNILQALNPMEIYNMATMLEKKIKQLELEKYALLYNRNRELKETVKKRTIELHNKVKREKLIGEIAERIRVSLHVEDILNTCVEELQAFSMCDRVLVYQFEPDWSGVIVAESVRDGLPQSIGNKVEDCCFQESLANGTKYNTDEAIAINNIYTAGYPDCYIELVEQYQIKATLIVPIRLQGQLWGLLIGHQCEDFRAWQEEDITLFQEIVVNLAIAIQQSINYHNLENELKERQKAEKLVQESDSRFRQLAENIDQVFYLMDLQQEQVLYINSSYEHTWGKSCQSLYNNPLSYIENVHPEDRYLVTQAYEHQKLGKQTTLEYRIIRPDGELRWILDRTFPVKSSDVNTCRICGIAEDITEGKLNDIELIKSQTQLEITSHRLQEAQRIAKLGHWEHNFRTNLSHWSDEVFEIFEVNKDTFTGNYEQIIEFVYPDDRKSFHQSYQKHINGT